MALLLTLRERLSIPIEVPRILPETLRGLTRTEIERQSILVGNQCLNVGDCFTVQGDLDDGTLRWQGDLRNVHRIGEFLSSGRIRVEGDAGRHIGNRSSGGEIEITGSVGDWLGAEMSSGKINVRHDAGDLVGASYWGSIRGMRGGTILVHGNSGRQVGRAMRRGLIVTAGNCQGFVGMNMLAGSIFVAGQLGDRPGISMKRGTIATFAGSAKVPLTFATGWQSNPLAIGRLLEDIQRLGMKGFPSSRHWMGDFYHGDMLEGGRGELVVGRDQS